MKEEHFEYSPYMGGALIGHVLWLKKQKKTTKELTIIQSINISSIILLCTYVESTLYFILSSIVKKRKSENDDLLFKSLLDHCDERIYKASWSQYVVLSEMILLKSLDNYTNNETWKGISILFNIRNVLVHGKSVKSSYRFEQNKLIMDTSGLLEIVMKYLRERKVISGKVYPTEKLLSNQVVNHFLKVVTNFIDELVTKISAEHKIELSTVINFSIKSSMILHGIEESKDKNLNNPYS